MASNAENVSIWWRHQACSSLEYTLLSLTSPLAHIVYLPTSWPLCDKLAILYRWSGLGYICIPVLELMQMHPKERLRRVIITASWFIAINVGQFFPWEFPEISLAYSHISLKGPSRSMIYGKIFWPPHPPSPYSQPGLHLPSKSTILFFRFSFHLTIYFENAGNICNKYDLSIKHIRHINDIN